MVSEVVVYSPFRIFCLLQPKKWHLILSGMWLDLVLVWYVSWPRRSYLYPTTSTRNDLPSVCAFYTGSSYLKKVGLFNLAITGLVIRVTAFNSIWLPHFSISGVANMKPSWCADCEITHSTEFQLHSGLVLSAFWSCFQQLQELFQQTMHTFTTPPQKKPLPTSDSEERHGICCH